MEKFSSQETPDVWIEGVGYLAPGTVLYVTMYMYDEIASIIRSSIYSFIYFLSLSKEFLVFPKL